MAGLDSFPFNLLGPLLIILLLEEGAEEFIPSGDELAPAPIEWWFPGVNNPFEDEDGAPVLLLFIGVAVDDNLIH